jgi:hypothetical protein
MNAVQAFSMSLKLGFPVSFFKNGLAYFSQLAVLVDQDLQHAFPVIANLHTPVALPVGWLRLDTRPAATESLPVMKMIGTTRVASFCCARGNEIGSDDDVGPMVNQIRGQCR